MIAVVVNRAMSRHRLYCVIRLGLLCGVFPDIAAFIRCMKAGFMR